MTELKILKLPLNSLYVIQLNKLKNIQARMLKATLVSSNLNVNQLVRSVSRWHKIKNYHMNMMINNLSLLIDLFQHEK